ncbi:MAG: AAA family ATPase, partial [Gammaproteobacteria bacterium]|nr:AAA family ATPase [Gammaproteobacteria bacterium]
MYEQHFGFNKRPFSAQATGSDVFVGPQTAKTMAGFRKALAAQDAVVTVSGPVGTGKTTLVHRALEGLGTRYKTIRVGRMEMKSSDVLESLLIVLGVQDRPKGTIQRFAALRRKLKELQDAEIRVFIVIEDGLRTGAETLAELEALTASDAGESDGASIVVMGDERLPQFMKDPEVAQLQQRVRQRHAILPLCVAELRGYLTHCFRQAGVDFEHVFDARSAELLHELSNGIPRIANNLVESSLAAAAGQGIHAIPATLIATVASDEYGLSADNFDFSIPEPLAEVAAEPAPEPEPVVDVAPEPEPEAVVDAAPEPTPEPEPGP